MKVTSVPYHREIVSIMKELQPQAELCSICSSTNLKRFKAHASDTPDDPTLVRIIECLNCHFAWQYPLQRSTDESIQEFDLNYRAQGGRLSDYFNPNRKREIALLEYEFISQLDASGKRLLDIGAGSGVFAEVAAENGWTVTAIDPALDLNRLTENKMITPIRGNMDELQNKELFDVVTMWDVIEHVATPIEMIINATAHLKSGGWLVIETGNYKSADRVEGGIQHWIYQLDHRWYFSPESIAQILRKIGLSEFTNSNKALRPGWSGNTDYMGPSRAILLKTIAKTPLKILTHISIFRTLLKAKKWPMANIGIFAVAARK